MKSVDSGLNTHIGLTTTSLATCWKIKRTDGVILTATDHDVDIPFDLVDDGEGDGELIYKSDTGFNRSALEGTADFKVGNMELLGLIESTTITKADIRSERYDFAQVWIFQVNWKDTSQNELKLQTGYLGQISILDDIFVAEFRDLLQLFLNEIGDIVTEECRVDLFDIKCKVTETPNDWLATTAYAITSAQAAEVGDYVKSTVAGDSNRIFRCTVGGTSHSAEPTWNLTIGGSTVETGGVTWETLQANRVTATVDVVTERATFTITTSPATDAPDLHFREGTAIFTSGPNSTLVKRGVIKDWDLGTRTITLARPMPDNITSGETLLISAGCDKSDERCAAYFNIFNFRGFPHVPGQNKIVEVPIRPTG